MLSPDERPILVCRIENPPHMAEGVDEWMPKHFDDSLDHEAVTSVVSYRVTQDFDADNGLPWILNGHGNRFIVYVADSIEGLADWMDSPQLREAIDDGVDRESAFPELDAEPFIGNVYEVTQVHKPLDVDFPGPTAILVERFEVGPEHEEEFTAWLEGPHAQGWAALGDAMRVRTFRQYLDLPKEFPFNRYQSKGNRMIMVELPLDADPRALVRRPEVNALLADSLRWDLELPYVRREFAVNHVIRDKKDAQETFEARRAEAAG